MFESPTAAPCCYLLGFFHLGETTKSEQHFNLWGCSPASLIWSSGFVVFSNTHFENVSENPTQRAFVVMVLLLRIQLTNTWLNTFREVMECSVVKCSVCYRRPGCSGRRTGSVPNKVILQIYECAQFSHSVLILCLNRFKNGEPFSAVIIWEAGSLKFSCWQSTNDQWSLSL